MKFVQVGVFKAEFSDILQQVKDQGETFIIEFGKNHKKVAMLIPYQEAWAHQAPRVFGCMKYRGAFEIHDDFDMTDDEFLGHD